MKHGWHSTPPTKTTLATPTGLPLACKPPVGALAEGAAACAARAIQPINKEAPLGVTGGASWIRCFSIYDQRAPSTRAPPQGFFVIVRFFVVRNMNPTLPDPGRQVKGPYRTRTSKHR
jgi:hypothetical protein